MKEKQESPRRRCLLILIEKIPNAMKLTFLFLGDTCKLPWHNVT